MNFTRNRKREDYIMRLPLVAFIDVTLFLLLYFVMAGTLADAEADLSAAITPSPRGSGRGNDFSAQILYVEVAAGGAGGGGAAGGGGEAQYRLADKIMRTKADVVALLSRLPKEPGVIIRVADDVTVGAAAVALQASKDAGFRKVTYVATK